MRAPRPTFSSAARARLRRSDAEIERYSSGSSTLSITRRSLIRWKLWKMKPKAWLRRRATWRALYDPTGEQADQVEQRALAAAAGSHDADELGLLHMQVYAFQGQGFDLVGPVAFADI